jgi:UDP-glucose 4-epimerase
MQRFEFCGEIMKKSLVLGGNGYLGTELVGQLASRNELVVSVDFEWPEHEIENVEYIAADISDLNQLKMIFNYSEYSRVFHFAGISSLRDASKDFTKTIFTNSMLTLHVLSEMQKHGIARLIFASSMYVFSEKGGSYRLSKQISEQIVEEFCKINEMSASIIRFGSIYGPGSNDSNGLHEIIKFALNGNTIKYEGGADSMREYIHIRDAIKSCIEISDLSSLDSKVYLVTGDRLMRVHDVLLMIKEMLGSKKLIEFENQLDSGHYVATPYTYKPSSAVKYPVSDVLDFSHGLWELIHYVAGTENLRPNKEDK